MVGKLIVIEGIDGTGKSTQAAMLVEHLQKMGHDVVFSKEPTADGKFGKMIRAKLSDGFENTLEETMLFTLDRLDDVQRTLAPALDAGKVVVLDRYYFSSMAYQGDKGIDSEQIRAINEWFAPVPDLLIILDGDPARSLNRIGREKDTFEKMEYLVKVREIFLREKGKRNVAIVDADRPVAAVHADIMRHVRGVVPDKHQTTLDKYMRPEYSVNGVKWQVPLDIYIDPETVVTIDRIRKAMGFAPMVEAAKVPTTEQVKLTYFTSNQKTLADFSKPLQYNVKVAADTSDLNKKLDASVEKVRELDDAIKSLTDTIAGRKMTVEEQIKMNRISSGVGFERAEAAVDARLDNIMYGDDAPLKKYLKACEEAYHKNRALDDEHHGKQFRTGEFYVDRDGTLKFHPNPRAINN